MREGWSESKVGDVVEKIETVDPRKSPNVEFSYIDVSSVSRKFLKVTEASKLMGRDAPSRARRLVRSGDVIFATIRPGLKRVAEVPEHLDGAVCSTGFFVARGCQEIDGRFLFYWFLSDDFSLPILRLQRGAAYPAVSDSDVRRQAVWVPPLLEQKRIVAILDEAFEGIDTVVANTEKNLANARELFEASVAYRVFGDPDVKGWGSFKVEELALPKKGAIRTGPFGSQLLHGEFVDDGIAVLGIDNSVNNEFAWGKRRFITEEKYEALKRYTVNPGDVIITIMGTCGRCAIVPDDIPTAINTKHLCCITLDHDRCLPEFLHGYFLYHPVAREYLEKHAKGSIMAGLNMGIIKSLPVRLPDLGEQARIAAEIDNLRNEAQRLEAIYQQKLTALAELKQSLLQKAFSGELTAKQAETAVEEAAA